MPIWLDENTIKGELSKEEFLRQVKMRMEARVAKEIRENQPHNYGNDGMIEVYSETLNSNGIEYQLKVIRYFAVSRDEGFPLAITHGLNKIGKYVVVESNKGPSYDVKEFLGLSEFLYHDTLHSGQEDWSLKRQWDSAKEWAEGDCAAVPGLISKFEEKTALLKKELEDWVKTIEVKED